MTEISNSSETTKVRFWNRVQLIMVLIIFSAPPLGAWLYMEYGDKKFSSYGDIYQPVKVVPNLLMIDGEKEVALDDFRRQWVFLTITDAECNQRCEENVIKVRQLRFMQNNDMSRIRSVFLHEGVNETLLSKFREKYTDVEIYTAKIDKLRQWAKVLQHNDELSTQTKNRFYIIDPAGNLVMSYPIDADPNYMKKDIKRLLKASQIG